MPHSLYLGMFFLLTRTYWTSKGCYSGTHAAEDHDDDYYDDDDNDGEDDSVKLAPGPLSVTVVSEALPLKHNSVK